MNELQAILRGALPALARRYNILSLGLFGSTVRGEARPDSDVDILVEFNDTPGLLRFIELENDLSDLLGLHVDLVMPSALRPHIAKRILAEVERV